jgi:hypothetical protein
MALPQRTSTASRTRVATRRFWTPSRRVAIVRFSLRRCFLSIAAGISLALLTVSSAAEDPDESLFREQMLPLLRTYCFDCHDTASDIPLQADSTAEAIQKNRQRWARALAQVRLGTMPPEDGPEMSASTRKRLVDVLDQLSNTIDCVGSPNAGKVALTRLNRAEYRNTVLDLVGVDYSPADDFPGDDVGYGFDRIGDVLSLPPLLMEKYLDAAEFISGEAIYTPPPPQIYEVNKAPSALIGAEKYGRGERVTLASRGTVSLQPQMPFAGMCTLTITASGDQGGNEPVKMEVSSGRFKKVVNVPADERTDYEVTFRLARGKQGIDISFINDYYVAGKEDRNLHIHHVHLRGEERRMASVSDQELPPSHKRILFVRPSADVPVEKATAVVLGRFASRAFRRPASNEEVARLTNLAAAVRADGGSYEESVQVALQAILVSPHFLFKVETPLQVDSDGQMPEIGQYELATRISYFLWSSMPDDELLLLAHRGQLRDRDRLFGKVGRMIQDPRANQLVENFAGQWLQLRNLSDVQPDTRIYRGFNEQVRELMRRETLTFFAGVMRQNMPVTTLLDADFTYLNEDLARFYGIKNVVGDEFRPVSLSGTTRGGLLTHASILTVTSNPTRTSPVKRGKWILENLLNLPPPPAPANVPELEKSKLVGTLRQRMEQHRSSPACAVCHNMMDPLGFALENFDAVGRWRTRDGRDEVDASGKLPDGTEFRGVADLRRLLSTTRRDEFVRCLAEKMLIYAIGRGTEYYDHCAIEEIVTRTRDNDYRFAYLIAAIIDSDPFQKQGHRD